MLFRSIAVVFAACCALRHAKIAQAWTVVPQTKTMLSRTTTKSFAPAGRTRIMDRIHSAEKKRSSRLSLALDDSTMDASPFVIAAVAIVLGVSAQSFINQMLKGDQGLGAFLSDGSGFQKSGFKSVRNVEERNDPLPWLRLPELDFVDVAGQESSSSSEAQVYERLEILRDKMNSELRAGRIEEATRIKADLERIMDANGIEFKAGSD